MRKYERRQLREGKSPAAAKRARLEFAYLIKQIAIRGTLWEQEIRMAIHTDRRALRNLRYFVKKDQNCPKLESEFNLIVMLSMWAHAQDWNSDRSEMRGHRRRFIPRDEFLLFLRQRGANGATHGELITDKVWQDYAMYSSELRMMGFKIETTQIKTSGGNRDCRFVLKEEPKRHKLVTKREEFARIAKAIQNLGRPPWLREVWRLTSTMARMEAGFDRHQKEESAAARLKQTFEDDLVRLAGTHLKRMTYLMGLADATAHNLKNPASLLGERLFVRLQRRRYPRRKV
ncbi:MAG TPA: hypothetical protein VKB40_00275 [Candidatus Acidoferrales bacterium]|nr:hypothetical protein [Candidatus Acidoferrales bacterium]